MENMKKDGNKEKNWEQKALHEPYSKENHQQMWPDNPRYY